MPPKDAGKERDWDRELAEVDRLLAKLPTHEPTRPMPAAAGARPGAAPAGPAAAPPTRLGSWVKVGLGLAVALAMAQWPYSHVCGLKLMLYLVGVGTVIATGVWGSVATWRTRTGFAHALAQIVLMSGVLLAVWEVAPRIASPTESAPWFCPEPPAARTP